MELNGGPGSYFNLLVLPLVSLSPKRWASSIKVRRGVGMCFIVVSLVCLCV